jgi:hypothetical protein
LSVFVLLSQTFPQTRRRTGLDLIKRLATSTDSTEELHGESNGDIQFSGETTASDSKPQLSAKEISFFRLPGIKSTLKKGILLEISIRNLFLSAIFL